MLCLRNRFVAERVLSRKISVTAEMAIDEGES
jgi:hypothetical protein